MRLLERNAALDVLASALQSARSGEGALALIRGEAGIGKTSLVDWFLQEHRAGTRSAVGYCEPLNSPQPLAPFHDFARRLGAGLPASFDRQRFLPDLLAELGRRPTILVIEDAHWADDASIYLIRFLGRRIAGLPLLLIVTHRDDELDHAHPLRGMLAALATSQATRRIELQRLSPEAVLQLADPSRLDGSDVYRRTGGNPFLVAEIVAAGDVSQVPSAVRDLTNARLARLSPSALRIAQIAAVAGRPEASLLQALAPDAADATQACLHGGLLRVEAEAIGFRHDLLRQAVLETISPPLLLQVHADVLRALVQAGAAQPARLAHHAHGARDRAAVLAYAPLAAKEAAAAGGHREAAAQYALALDYLGAGQTAERAALLMEHAQACAALDRLGEAVASFEEAAAISRTLGERGAEGAALAALALPLVRSGRNREADEQARRAITLLEADGPSRRLAFALRIQAQLRMLDRDKAQALHFGRRAIGMAEAVGDVRILAAANMTVGTALLVADQPEGRPYLDRAMHLAESAGFDDLHAQVFLNLGSAYGEQYHFAEAERFLNEGIAFASARDLDQDLHYMQSWLPLVHLYRGRLRQALDAGLALLATSEVAAVSRIMALVAVGRARARLGRDGCKEALDEALALAAPTGTLQRLAPVRLARAEAAWLSGERDEARAEADAVRQLAVSHRHQWHAGEAAYWAALPPERGTAPDWIARPFALQLEGRWQEAAEAWRTLGCPYEEARALSEGDEQAQLAALRLFERIEAAPAAALLRQRLRQSGVRHLPRGPRAATRLSAFGLTARQADVLTLLAEGLTNEAIARRLKISAKTVDHHVSAILERLGVTSRKDAAGKLRAHEAASRAGQPHVPT